MPDFGNPFSGQDIDKKLSKDELVRAIKFMLAAELEATQMYDQVADATTDKTAEKIIRDISDEERVHAGEFFKLLTTVDPKEAELFQKGEQEAEEKMGKKSMASLIRSAAKKIKDSGYEWQKGDWDPKIKTLKYVSPFTGKKFHVSPSASIDPYAAILMSHMKRPVNVANVVHAAEEIKKQKDKLSSESLKKILTDHHLVLFSSAPDTVDKLLFNIMKINKK
jgi:rubrerythrin